MSQVSVILWSWLQHTTVQTLSLHLSFSEPNWMTPGIFLLYFQMVLFGRKKCKRWPMRNDLVGVIVCDFDGLSLSSTHFAFSRGQPSRAIRFQELSWERNVQREPVLAVSACSKAKAELPSRESHPQAGFGCVQWGKACLFLEARSRCQGALVGMVSLSGVSLLRGWPRVLRRHPGQFPDRDLVSRSVDGVYSGVMGVLYTCC